MGGIEGTTGPELQGEKPQGSRYATVFKRREHTSGRSRFYNVFLIGLVRPRVRLITGLDAFPVTAFQPPCCSSPISIRNQEQDS